MSHAANQSWAGVADRYGDAEAGSGGVDRRFDRYMGRASDFPNLARKYLGDSTEPTHYHAQAAATLLMMQMAMDHFVRSWQDIFIQHRCNL